MKNYKKMAIITILTMLIAGQIYAAIITFHITGEGSNVKGRFLTGTERIGQGLISQVRVYFTRNKKGVTAFQFGRRKKAGDTFSFDDSNTTMLKIWKSNREYIVGAQQTRPIHKRPKSKSKKSKKKRSRLFYKGYQDMFKPVFGFEEETFRSNKNNYKSQIKRLAGTYKEYTYKQLKDLVQKNKKNFGGKGFIRKISKPVQQIIAEEKDLSNAAIQSASTVAGLEGGMYKIGSRLNNMQGGAVQGETVSACLLPGIIDRMYFEETFRKGYYPGLIRYFYPNKGKNFDWKKNIDNMKIGLQKGVTIVYEADMAGFAKGEAFRHSRRPNVPIPYLRKAKAKHRTTSQIISFAINFGKVPKTRENLAFAKELLIRQFLMAVWVANINDIRTVYLTLLGGGSFDNPKHLIDAALNNPELIRFINETGMYVYVVDVQAKGDVQDDSEEESTTYEEEEESISEESSEEEEPRFDSRYRERLQSEQEERERKERLQRRTRKEVKRQEKRPVVAAKSGKLAKVRIELQSAINAAKKGRYEGVSLNLVLGKRRLIRQFNAELTRIKSGHKNLSQINQLMEKILK